jgi:hypothetical protein
VVAGATDVLRRHSPAGRGWACQSVAQGMDGTFAVLGPLQVGYLDYFGSGSETIAHLRENGRITLMFSAFEGRLNIVPLYGRESFMRPWEAEFDELRRRFCRDRTAGQRSIVLIDLDRVQESCGYSVPKVALLEQRDILDLYQEKKGPERPTSTTGRRPTRCPSTACPPWTVSRFRPVSDGSRSSTSCVSGPPEARCHRCRQPPRAPARTSRRWPRERDPLIWTHLRPSMNVGSILVAMLGRGRRTTHPDGQNVDESSPPDGPFSSLRRALEKRLPRESGPDAP